MSCSGMVQRFATMTVCALVGCNAIFGIDDRAPLPTGGDGGSAGAASSSATGGAASTVGVGGGGAGGGGMAPTSFAVRFGDVGNDIGHAVAVTSRGDIVLGGRINGDVTFGSLPLSSTFVDGVLVGLDPTGDPRWAFLLTDFGNSITSQAFRDVVVDPTDDALIAVGFVRGTTDVFGSGVASAGVEDIIVLELALTGPSFDQVALGWQKTYGGVGFDTALAATVGANGDVEVVGTFEDTVSFEGTPYTAQGQDAFAVALSGQDGSQVVADQVGGVDDETLLSAAVDGAGNRYVAGFAQRASTETEVIVKRFGTFAWEKRYGTAGYNRAAHVSLMSDGNLLVVGTFNGTLTLGTAMHVSNGGTDVFVLTLDPTGVELWSTSIGGIGSDVAEAAVEDGGRVVIAGHTDSVDVTPSCGTVGLPGLDALVLEVTVGGALTDCAVFGGAGPDRARGVTLQDGSIVLIGTFENDLTIEGTTLDSAGDTDIFVAKLAP